MKLVDVKLEGRQFGRLEVIQEAINSPRNYRKFYVCFCSCGVAKEVRHDHLLSGASKSCGRCVSSEKSKKHGMFGNKTYICWAGMRSRCNNFKSPSYQYYGLRGIKVCPRWNKFENFLEDMGERPEGMTLERIDVNDGYHKDNCRWATRQEQAYNKTNTRYLEFDGEIKSQAEWSKILGIKQSTIHRRIKLGWDIDKALSTPAGN